MPRQQPYTFQLETPGVVIIEESGARYRMSLESLEEALRDVKSQKRAYAYEPLYLDMVSLYEAAIRFLKEE